MITQDNTRSGILTISWPSVAQNLCTRLSSSRGIIVNSLSDQWSSGDDGWSVELTFCCQHDKTQLSWPLWWWQRLSWPQWFVWLWQCWLNRLWRWRWKSQGQMWLKNVPLQVRRKLEWKCRTVLCLSVCFPVLILRVAAPRDFCWDQSEDESTVWEVAYAV